MSASEKEWLRAEMDWLQREDQRLQRLYGTDYLRWLAAQPHVEHVPTDVCDKYDRLELQVASTPLHDRERKGTDLPRVEEPAWVSVRCTTGACKKGSCKCKGI